VLGSVQPQFEVEIQLLPSLDSLSRQTQPSRPVWSHLSVARPHTLGQYGPSVLYVLPPVQERAGKPTVMIL